VVDELSEELGTVIVPIFASGFASKAAVQGHDLAMHSLVKYVTAKQPEQRGDHINLLSTTELAQDREEAKRLLAALGLEAQTLPAGNGVGVFQRAAGAKLSVPLNFDVSSYLGEALQSMAGVPFLSVPRPIGLSAIKHWLLGVGAATGREAQARELHAREAAALAGLLEAAPLRGVRVYLSLEPATALGMLDLVQELGGEIAGLTVEHLDRLHIEALRSFQHRAPALQIHIANGQGFEELNLLQRIKPDLYVGVGGHLAQVAHLGIPAVFLPRVPILGYGGVASFARQALKALRNRAFVTQLATQLTTSGLPYHAHWFQRSPNWHIKQEVK
jgi:nitrogenase molybdenum-iron protein alpha/beta subunit